ncbi:MAG: SDR family oxidoreductase [Bauldia sp.]
MQIDLTGRRAVVTGGASGIGRVTVETLVSCGARVHICDIDSEAVGLLSDGTEGRVTGTVADVSDAAAIARVFEDAATHLGGLDILVNNAGIAGPKQPVEKIPPEELIRTMAVNVHGQFFCASRAVPLLRKAGGGCIINISSVAGRLGYGGRSAYSASKWALVGLTKSLAIELGHAQIRVNAVCPGAVDGPAIRQAIATRAAKTGQSEDTIFASYLDQSSLRTLVKPEDVAHIVAYLCSPYGERISGQIIGIDGNTEILNSERGSSF